MSGVAGTDNLRILPVIPEIGLFGAVASQAAAAIDSWTAGADCGAARPCCCTMSQVFVRYRMRYVKDSGLAE